MKKKDKQELRSKTISQLEKELLEKEKALIEARIKLVKRQLKNTNLPRFLRVDIAVIRTIINEKLALKKDKNETK
jgi:ribosomal protein L29